LLATRLPGGFEASDNKAWGAIRVTGYDVAASISGTVTTSLPGVSVEGLTVRADPTNGGTVPGYQTMSATGITASDGSYTLFFLVPGDYDVTVELSPGLGTDPRCPDTTSTVGGSRSRKPRCPATLP
jgi:hypothetical protein